MGAPSSRKGRLTKLASITPSCLSFAAKSVCPGAPDLTPLAQAAAYERQAVGRIARYPQRKTCHAYRMFAVGTVEEELYAVWGLV